MSKIPHIGTIHKTQVYHKGFEKVDLNAKRNGRNLTVPVIRFENAVVSSFRAEIPDSSPQTSQFVQETRYKTDHTGKFVAEGVINENNQIPQISFFPEKEGKQGKPDWKNHLSNIKYKPPLTYNPIDNSITASPNTKVTYEEQF